MFARPLAMAAVVLTVGLTAGPTTTWVRPAEDEVATEMAKLQGEWEMVSLDINDYKANESQTRVWLLVVEGSLYNPGSGEHSIEYTFRIDPSRTPKSIDLIPNEGPNQSRALRGIYSLDGDLFTVTRVLDPDDDRPAGFTARKGSGTTRVVWKRKKAPPRRR